MREIKPPRAIPPSHCQYRPQSPQPSGTRSSLSAIDWAFRAALFSIRLNCRKHPINPVGYFSLNQISVELKGCQTEPDKMCPILGRTCSYKLMTPINFNVLSSLIKLLEYGPGARRRACARNLLLANGPESRLAASTLTIA